MCGIAGIVDFAGQRVEAGRVERACALLRHRGPDDSGTWTRPSPPISLALGATRLAILDPTPAGRQPMVRAGGRFALVFNGLIYNFRELGEELAAGGVALQTRCDTEVVLWACARWGPAALNRFNGMWALAFFDLENGRGFLARDRFGIKPLLWCVHGERLCFASEMRALQVLEDWPRDVDTAALRHFIRFGYFAAPRTIFAAARRLEPGSYLPFDPGGARDQVRYYIVKARAKTIDVNSADVRPMIRRAMERAVARRRVADVPIGAFLSGGLDSAIIVSHLASLGSRPVTTFSVGWADHGAYDETRFARLVARRFGTEHHELRCRLGDVLDILPSMLDHLGEPFFDSSILPTAMVAEFARRQVTVCLSGDGGDELFAGYWRYAAHGFYERYRRLPAWLRRGVIEPLLRSAASAKSTGWSNRVRQFRKMLRAADLDALERHVVWSQILAPDARDVLRESASDDPHDSGALDHGAGDDAGDVLNTILLHDLTHALPGDMLHKVDIAGMYHSLEVRVPFLDPEVVELAASLPSAMKIGGGQGKAILRDAYRGLLPDEILARSKMGFEVPIGEFLRSELRDMFRDTVTREVIDSFGILNFDAVQRVYADHGARRGEHADLLFALLSLCWWRRSQSAIR